MTTDGLFFTMFDASGYEWQARNQRSSQYHDYMPRREYLSSTIIVLTKRTTTGRRSA